MGINRSVILSGRVPTITELLSWHAKNEPDEILYTFLKNGEEELDNLSYSSLEKESKNIAAALLAIAKPGERALLLYTQNREFVPAFFGCLYAGIIAVPVQLPQTQKADLSHIVKIIVNSGATIFLTTQATQEFISQNPELKKQIQNVKILLTDSISNMEISNMDIKHDSESIAFLQYTSGSTGAPKGVMVTHKNIMHNQSLVVQSFNSSEKDVMVTWLPFYHDMGLIGGILHPLYMGGKSILMSPMAFLQNPSRWLKAISKYKGSICGAPNFAYDLCVQKIKPDEINDIDLSHWRLAFNGAEKIRAQTLEQFAAKFSKYGFQKKFIYPTYGLAESTLFVTGGHHDKEPVSILVNREKLENNKIIVQGSENADSVKLISTGKTWNDQEISVVDPESHEVCENNKVGEIWIKGPSVAQGYWNNTPETERCFKAYRSDNHGPYFRTGDLGFYQNNNLYITGRLKDLVIVNGRNIYPEDMEFEVQSRIDGLKFGGGVVFSCDLDNSEKIVLVQEVEREKIKKIDDGIFSEINRAINKKFMVNIAAISLIMPYTLPKTTSGKVRRKVSKELFLSGRLNERKIWFMDPSIEKYCIEKRQKLSILLRETV